MAAADTPAATSLELTITGRPERLRIMLMG